MTTIKRVVIAVTLAILLIFVIPIVISLAHFPHARQMELILQTCVIAWAIIYIVQGL